jgi:hypothetical protein
MYDSNLIQKKRLNKLDGTGPSFDKLQFTQINTAACEGGRQSIIQKAAVEKFLANGEGKVFVGKNCKPDASKKL